MEGGGGGGEEGGEAGRKAGAMNVRGINENELKLMYVLPCQIGKSDLDLI